MTKNQVFQAQSYLPLAHKLLAKSTAGGQMAPHTLDDLLARGSVHRHPPGHLLCIHGAQVVDLLFVIEGALEVSTASQSGRRSICWYIGPGDWMGMIPIIDGLGSVHTLVTHTESVLLHLPRAAFLELLARDVGLANACLKTLCERSRTLYDNLASKSLLTLRGRIARLLLRLNHQHGHKGHGGAAIDLKLSQDNLASMLAVTRQSLSRELKALEAAGILSIAYSRITLQQLDTLEQLAQGNDE